MEKEGLKTVEHLRRVLEDVGVDELLRVAALKDPKWFVEFVDRKSSPKGSVSEGNLSSILAEINEMDEEEVVVEVVDDVLTPAEPLLIEDGRELHPGHHGGSINHRDEKWRR